ncbi:hypothetical protein [Brevundimonas diminuta]|uniref:hypothetical protein n=1 Tax=Brevundimonas diminuta TaxID=293 RepID=UPI003D07892C
MKPPAPRSAYLNWLASVLRQEDEAQSASRPPDDLVLGYATGYDAAMIAPFVRSLRAHFDGPAALVVDQRPDVLKLLADHAVEAVFADKAADWAPHPVVTRFALYAQLVRRWPHAANVLLTDVRDVIFQGDPFNPRPARLEVFVEYEEGRLGDHAFNMKYLTALVGVEMAGLLKTRPCLCVGTVMGPREEIIRFCRVLLMLAAIPRSEIGGAFGADQAACNLAVHLGLVPASVRRNFGRVATLGMTDGQTLGFVNGRVTNPDGGASPIVHQHDRHPHLADAVHSRWAPGERLCGRATPKTTADRGRRLKQSLLRRLPELR